MAVPRSNGPLTERVRPIGESVRALQRDTRELLGAVEQLSSSAGDALREQIDERPYATLGAAFVTGYVLGGGLSLRLATMLAAAAARASVAQMLARGISRPATATHGGKSS